MPVTAPTAPQTDYDTADVMHETFFEDLYLFDLAQDGQIVAARAPHSRMRRGDRFLDLLTPDATEELTAYLKGYQKAPLIIDTSAGIAIILPSLMPDTALGVALFPYARRASLLHRLSAEKRIPLLWASSLTDHASDHVRYDKALKRVTPMLDLAVSCLATPEDIAPISDTCLSQQLAERLYALSHLSGCPIHLSPLPELQHHGEFNLSLFTAFALVSLLLCRDASLGREAFVSLKSTDAGIAVLCRIPGPAPQIRERPELLWLDQLANRKRLIFEYTLLENQLHLSWFPMDAEWSRLGLKQPGDTRLFSATDRRE